jgi:hypothetical protein
MTAGAQQSQHNPANACMRGARPRPNSDGCTWVNIGRNCGLQRSTPRRRRQRGSISRNWGGSKVTWQHMHTVAYTGYMDKRTGGMAVCSQWCLASLWQEGMQFYLSVTRDFLHKIFIQFSFFAQSNILSPFRKTYRRYGCIWTLKCISVHPYLRHIL